jgi:Ocular albinism type 1 protein
MPSYILNYGTILVVMIANPILYFQCSKEVNKQLIQRYGQFTNNERQILDMFKIKFSLINTIFFICWMPNIINAVLMWTMWFHLPVRVIIGSWYVIAILNPLQAFLNVLVYRQWNNKLNCCTNLRNIVLRRFRGSVIDARTSPNEASPLLPNTPVQEAHTFSRNENFHSHSIQRP